MPPFVSAQKVTKVFGGVPLFEDLSFVIAEDERTALIGANGAGKSTLLKILSGLQEPDDGTVSRQNGLHIGLISQTDTFYEEQNVYEAVAEAIPDEASDKERRIARALGEAQFHDDHIPIRTLSGGWRKRLSIARELAKAPDLLFLDEPTNHLDIEGILWLEKLLKEAPFASVFVSHDRYFIESVATRVIEIGRQYPGGTFVVNGSYSEFLSKRSDHLLQSQQQKESLANKVRREVEWLRQGAKARTTKSKHRSDEAYRLLDELKKIPSEHKATALEFSNTKRRSQELMKLENVGKQFADKVLFQNVSFVFSPGTRLGVVGSNGAGKSTFLKTLLGQLPPDKGTITRAKGLSTVFFDQMRTVLNPKEMLQQALCKDGGGNEASSVVFNGKEIHVIGWATRFLFRREQLSLPVGQLSGGEQARLILARMMLEPADILFLDEPTNDLDIPTLEVLEESLDSFPGAIVLVTHDRYLLDRVATHVLGLSPHGDSIIYASYTQWEIARQEWREKNKKLDREKSSTPKQEGIPQKQTKFTFAQQKEWDSIEERILQAEEEVAAHEAALQGVEPLESESLNVRCEALTSAQKKVEDLYARWEELSGMKKGFG